MNTTTNRNTPPKDRFKEIPEFVHAHRELMQSPNLRRSLDYALLEYQRRVCRETNEQMAGAGHFRMLGATEFIDVLINLAETIPMPTLVPRGNLDHKA